MVNITIALPHNYVNALNNLANRGIIETRSHGIREAIKLFFLEEPNFNKLLKNDKK